MDTDVLNLEIVRKTSANIATILDNMLDIPSKITPILPIICMGSLGVY